MTPALQAAYDRCEAFARLWGEYVDDGQFRTIKISSIYGSTIDDVTLTAADLKMVLDALRDAGRKA